MSSGLAAITGHYKVLLIEDNPDVARSLLPKLSELGLECRYAPDAASGTACFQELQPDLVLLDLGLPGRGGYEVYADIRRNSVTPIIIMIDQASIAESGAFKHKSDEVMAKPVSAQQMVLRVTDQLNRTRGGVVAMGGATPSTADFQARIPKGWAGCESCQYMGPRAKFDSRGQVMCPNCKSKSKEDIIFSVS